jgi:hypothetical protein
VLAENVGKRTFVEVLVGKGHCTAGTTLPMEGHVNLEDAIPQVQMGIG